MDRALNMSTQLSTFTGGSRASGKGVSSSASTYISDAGSAALGVLYRRFQTMENPCYTVKKEDIGAGTEEWGVVATRDIKQTEFIDFFSGNMGWMTPETKESSYNMAVSSEVCIIPYADIDEDKIPLDVYLRNPMAMMNEPMRNAFATVALIPIDFHPDEIHFGAEKDASKKRVRVGNFYRGIACVACDDIQKGQLLTWDYGPTYRCHREKKKYTAGRKCPEFVIEHDVIAKQILSSYRRKKVPLKIGDTSFNVFPMNGGRPNRPLSNDVEDEPDDETSGGAHGRTREERLLARTRQKESAKDLAD